ncbi:zinc finger, CCHC-type containing protein [Tanacetum coccineum]
MKHMASSLPNWKKSLLERVWISEDGRKEEHFMLSSYGVVLCRDYSMPVDWLVRIQCGAVWKRAKVGHLITMSAEVFYSSLVSVDSLFVFTNMLKLALKNYGYLEPNKGFGGASSKSLLCWYYPMLTALYSNKMVYLKGRLECWKRRDGINSMLTIGMSQRFWGGRKKEASLIIHQMDIKTAFLNGVLEEEVYMNQPLGFILPGNENKSHYIEKVLKKFNYSDCNLVSTPLDTCEKLMPNKVLAVSQLVSFPALRVSNSEGTEVLEGKPWNIDCYLLLWLSAFSVWGRLHALVSWISNMKKLLTSGLGSGMEAEFVALAAAGKEAQWLKNLLLEIPLWVKPMTPISILCDSAATLAKAYSQMYNGKSRHLGVRHSMIRELITNGVISVSTKPS